MAQKLKQKRIRKDTVLLALMVIVVALVTVISTVIIYSSFFMPEPRPINHVIRIGMDARVDDHAGFVTDPDAFHFGRLMPGSSSSRFATLSNGYEVPQEVYIVGEGEMAEWIVLKENPSIIPAISDLNITVRLDVPEGTEYGNYTGTLIFQFRDAE